MPKAEPPVLSTSIRWGRGGKGLKEEKEVHNLPGEEMGQGWWRGVGRKCWDFVHGLSCALAVLLSNVGLSGVLGKMGGCILLQALLVEAQIISLPTNAGGTSCLST